MKKHNRLSFCEKSAMWAFKIKTILFLSSWHFTFFALYVYSCFFCFLLFASALFGAAYFCFFSLFLAFCGCVSRYLVAFLKPESFLIVIFSVIVARLLFIARIARKNALTRVLRVFCGNLRADTIKILYRGLKIHQNTCII